MNPIDRTVALYHRGVAAARKRSALFDHVWRARERFNDVLGGRLAAAISYYGFFAALSLVLAGYTILHAVLGPDSGFLNTVEDYLNDDLALINAAAGDYNGAAVTAVSLTALVLAGVAWVDNLRSAQRAIWHLEQHPGNWFIRRLVDFGMLIGLGLLLGLSLAVTSTIRRLLPWQTVVSYSGPVLELGVNVLLASAMLAAVPRLRMGPRRLLPTAIAVALGIQLLNTVGRYYIGRTQASPAYGVVTGAVGLLVYLYLLNQLIIFGAAIAATSTRGDVVDLAAGPVPEAVAPDPESVEAERAHAARRHAQTGRDGVSGARGASDPE